MRWRPYERPPTPRIGTRRLKRAFLWWPKTLPYKNTSGTLWTRWLEYAVIYQNYAGIHYQGGDGWADWYWDNDWR